ncbi:MAG: hypothetical protein ACR2H0_06925 [Candidatus Limnocylindrales bacterium]
MAAVSRRGILAALVENSIPDNTAAPAPGDARPTPVNPIEPASTPPPPPPPPPDATPPPPGVTPPSRLRQTVGHPQALSVALAVLIGFASVFSAVVAWRASLASIDASRYDSLAVQQAARRGQIERDLEGLIAQDLRFVNVYQEHALAARELTAQAETLRETDPDSADILDLEAQARLDLARAVKPFFLAAGSIKLSADGIVEYDAAFVLRNLADGNAELRELRTQRTPELAARADARSVSLVGVAAFVVAALFFLTIAQVSRARRGIREMFFATGAILVVVGTVGFVLVELLA